MYRKAYIIIFLYLLNIAFSAYSQRNTVDSLKHVLKVTSVDAKKISILTDIAYSYRNSKPDSAIAYANAAIVLAQKANYPKGVADASIFLATALWNLSEFDGAFKVSKSAIEFYDKISKIGSGSLQIVDSKQKARAYNIQGLILKSQKKYAEAIEYLSTALELRKQFNDSIDIAQSYRNIADTYKTSGNYSNAADNYFKTINFSKNLKVKELALDSIFDIMMKLYHKKKLDIALEYGRAFLKISTAINDSSNIANVYNFLGVINQDQGKYDEALKNYSTALEISISLKDSQSVCKNNFNIGNVYSIMDNYSKAQVYYDDVIKNINHIRDSLELANIFNNIGKNLKFLKKNEESSKYFFKALALYTKIKNNEGIADSYLSIGILFFEQKFFNEAQNYFYDALKYFNTIGSTSKIAICNQYIGMVFYMQDKDSEALTYYKMSLKMSNLLNDKRSSANTLNNIAVIYENNDNYKEALKIYFEILDTYSEIGDKEGIVRANNNIANYYCKEKEFKNATKYLKKAVLLADELKDFKLLSIIHYNFADIESGQGNYKDALSHYKQGVAFEGYLNYESNIKALTETKLSYSAERQADSLKMVAIMNEISMQKEQAIKQLQYEYEKKQQQTKNEKEKEKLKYEETLKREKIEFDYNKKTQELKFQEDLKRRKIAFDFEQKKQQISSEQKRKEILLKSEQEKKNAVSQKEIEKQKLLRNSFIGGAFLLLLVAFSIFRSLLQNRKANIIITEQKMEVEKQKEFVDERNREILDSIKYAKRIQSTILPPLSKIKSAIPNVFVLYLPKDIVAGDFYWMYSHTINGEENRLFAACDCTGHGVPGAMVSVVCNNALNRVVREMDNCKPSLILDKVSELVIQDFSLNNEDDDEVKDGMDISLCSFNPANGILQWAGANNPLWIIKANGSLLEYKADKQPVGKYYNRKPFTNHEIQLEKGDTLYLFTDGYADQFGGEKNSKFQRKALKKLLVSGYLQTMDQQQENLFKTFENWKGINEQVDDICIIGVRV